MSYGSRLILERLGIWPQIAPATPIETIHVSQRGGFGRTLLSAQEAHLPALGYVVRYAGLQQAFGSALASEHITLLAGAEVTATQSTADGVAIEYRQHEREHSIAARLLIIADGGASAGLRAGATVKTREYGQHAVVGLVQTSHPHSRKAYERFTPDGPIALLPFENRHALIWTAAPETADRLLALAPAAFLEKLQQHFGDRAGRFLSIEARARFPLTLRYAEDPVLPRTVLLGNAAQALHPIAGQGFNLGLRDAATLAEMLASGSITDFAPTAAELLEKFAAWRAEDRKGVTRFTDSLVKLFGSDTPGVGLVRNFGLLLFDMSPAAKRALSRVSWGFAGRMPRLARGLPLE
jgi:2-octaprenyl-6-methoxyphenol hydroxylase